MSKAENEKIAALLRKDSLEDLCSLLTDPCDGCEVDSNRCPGMTTCGYTEQEGMKVGKQHALIELRRRKTIIDNSLHVWG
jgi:hypothetical protein